MSQLIVRFCSVFIILGFLGCTRDDICSEDTPTTPLMVITFNDIANPTLRKAVTGLTVQVQGFGDDEVISESTTDSIAIPLNTAGIMTQYKFVENDNSGSRNVDYVQFNYTTEDIYVNRACAFKSIYHDLLMSVQSEGSANWILSFEILTTDIEDESQTHITIFH